MIATSSTPIQIHFYYETVPGRSPEHTTGSPTVLHRLYVPCARPTKLGVHGTAIMQRTVRPRTLCKMAQQTPNQIHLPGHGRNEAASGHFVCSWRSRAVRISPARAPHAPLFGSCRSYPP